MYKMFSLYSDVRKFWWNNFLLCFPQEVNVWKHLKCLKCCSWIKLARSLRREKPSSWCESSPSTSYLLFTGAEDVHGKLSAALIHFLSCCFQDKRISLRTSLRTWMDKISRSEFSKNYSGIYYCFLLTRK